VYAALCRRSRDYMRPAIQAPVEPKAALKFTVTCDYMRLVDPLEKHPDVHVLPHPLKFLYIIAHANSVPSSFSFSLESLL